MATHRIQTPASKATARITPARPVAVDALSGKEHLTLRPLQESDRDAFCEIVSASRELLDRFSPLHRPGESDDELFDRQLQMAIDGDASGKACRRVGVLDDGTLVGAFNLNEISRGLTWEADANWWVDARLCGRGLATLGVRALLRFAFDDLPAGLGLQRVTCSIMPENAASRRVAEKAGFCVQEGVCTHLHLGQRWVRHEVFVAAPSSVQALSA